MYLVIGILLAFIREYVALCVKLKWLFMFFYGLLFLALLFSYKGILWWGIVKNQGFYIEIV